jgi:molybdopterin molybdotransferase
MTLSEASWVQARAAAMQVAQLLPAESVTINDLDGRVLAVDVSAHCDLPSFDSSAMDGWAVSGAGPWLQIGDARAGVPFPHDLAAGQAVRIATGAVVPTGATAVLRWENAVHDGDLIVGEVNPGSDIRPAGEEVRTGDVIATAGTRITPALAGFLAATGHDHVEVIRQPRVHVLLLGDELLQSGIPHGGRVRDSLGPQLPGWLTRMGASVIQTSQIRDELPAVIEAFTDVGDADLIVTTGGTAAGPRDHLHAAISHLQGELLVDCVAVRPGHPMLLAKLGSIPLIGLPGNPHSAVVGLMTLGQPVLTGQLGMREQGLATVRTAEELRCTAGHTRLIAGIVRDGVFILAGYDGSAMLRGLAQADGFAVVDQDVAAGSAVSYLPLPRDAR